MTDRLSQIRERCDKAKWEYEDGIVIDPAYEGTGLINAPEANGTVFLQDQEQAQELVKAHNALLDRVAELETRIAEMSEAGKKMELDYVRELAKDYVRELANAANKQDVLESRLAAAEELATLLDGCWSWIEANESIVDDGQFAKALDMKIAIKRALSTFREAKP